MLKVPIVVKVPKVLKVPKVPKVLKVLKVPYAPYASLTPPLRFPYAYTSYATTYDSYATYAG